jgi:hypothetical protein
VWPASAEVTTIGTDIEILDDLLESSVAYKLRACHDVNLLAPAASYPGLRSLAANESGKIPHNECCHCLFRQAAHGGELSNRLRDIGRAYRQTVTFNERPIGLGQ